MNKQILRLAIPSILANITIPLVGLVDTAIVGHISDAHAIGGIAIGTMLFDLVYWNFGFLRVGTSGMTAQAFGRGDKEQCARLLTQSVSIALIGAAAIWLLQWLFVTAAMAIVPGRLLTLCLCIRPFPRSLYTNSLLWVVMFMYLGSNTFRRSIVLNNCAVPLPFRGGSTSKENGLLLLSFIRSITFMLCVALYAFLRLMRVKVHKIWYSTKTLS